MRKYWRVFLATCLAVIVASCGQSETSSSSKDTTSAAKTTAVDTKTPATSASYDCELTIGFDVWEPYQFVGFGRKVQGLDIELIQLVADRLSCQVKYQQDSWGNLLVLLKSGKIDLVLGASITDERKTYALFSEPYRSEEFLLYIRAEEEHKYRQASVVDFVLDGKKIGIIGEYFYGDELSSLMDDEKYGALFNPAFMGEINLARLLDGDIDGFLEDSFVGASLVRRKGLEKYITPHQAKISTGDVYVMFSRASVKPELVGDFNKALLALKNSGEYDKLVNKYSQ